MYNYVVVDVVSTMLNCTSSMSVISKIANIISGFIRGMCVLHSAYRGPVPTNWPANGALDVHGEREIYGSQYAYTLLVMIDCHPRLRRRWRPG